MQTANVRMHIFAGYRKVEKNLAATVAFETEAEMNDLYAKRIFVLATAGSMTETN